MLADPQSSPLDLNFRLAGFPVRVSPWFWLIMALLGDSTLNDREIGPGALVVWVACGFVSILAHELGHAVLIRRFGSPTEIVLHGFGGFATMPYPPRSAWKRLAVALAGPGAGFLLLGLVVGSGVATGWPDASPYADRAFLFLVLMNLFWNLLNLLPIWPLDGGRVCREVCHLLGLRRPDRVSLGISVATAGGLAVYGLLGLVGRTPAGLDAVLPYRPGVFMTLWFALFAYESYQLLQAADRSRGWADPGDDRLPWRR